MRKWADDWRKALCGVLLGAIIFLTLLPYFGRAWHRVLPEHSHVFLGAARPLEQDVLPEDIQNDQQDFSTADDAAFTNTTVIHLPDPTLALQIFAIAIGLIALPFISAPPGFSSRVALPCLLYQSPSLPLPDPPPNAD